LYTVTDNFDLKSKSIKKKHDEEINSVLEETKNKVLEQKEAFDTLKKDVKINEKIKVYYICFFITFLFERKLKVSRNLKSRSHTRNLQYLRRRRRRRMIK
jgi:hypothetical protein